MILLSNNHLIKYSNKQLRVSHKLNTEHRDGKKKSASLKMSRSIYSSDLHLFWPKKKKAKGYALRIP